MDDATYSCIGHLGNQLPRPALSSFSSGGVLLAQVDAGFFVMFLITLVSS
jgi:hypothetical protein